MERDAQGIRARCALKAYAVRNGEEHLFRQRAVFREAPVVLRSSEKGDPFAGPGKPGPACGTASAGKIRARDDPVARAKFDSFREQDAPVLNEVGRLAAKYHVSYSAIALAWLLSKKEVASLLIGATKEKHLQEATQAFEVSLTEEDIQGLEKNYRPHPLIGVIPPPSSAK